MYYGALLILAGALLAFWGNTFLTMVIHFVVAISIIIIGGNIVFMAFSSTTATWLKITAFVLIFVFANFVGYVVSKMRRLGVGLLAGLAGCVVGISICTAG